MFQSRYPWVSGLSLSVENFKETKQNVSVTVSDVHRMVNSSLEVRGMNANILNSKLINFSLKFQGETTGLRAREENRLVVSKSTFIGSGTLNRISLKISKSFASLSEVQMSRAYQTVPILEVVDSELVLYQSLFNNNLVSKNHTGVLNFHDVKATVRNCTFEENRSEIGHGGAIRATVKSQIAIDECLLAKNDAFYAGGAIHAVSGVKVNITDSNFVQNTAFYHGGAISSSYKTTLSIVNSNFTSNNVTGGKDGGHGGAIQTTVETEITITECSFTKNAAFYAGGAIHAVNRVKINITDSQFSQNTAYHHGGAIASSHIATLRIINSNFTSNNSTLSNGGCITLTNETNVYIKNSNFYRNLAGMVGGVIHVDKSNTLVIEDSEFRHNVAKLNSGVMSASWYCTVNFTNTKFINNTGILTMSVLSVNHHVNISIDRCLFDGNPSAFTGLFEADSLTHTEITNSTFTRNSANVGSLMEIGNSTFKVHNSRFDENLGGILVYGHFHANLSFTNCLFSNHSLAADPLMVISDAHLELDRSTFVNNTQYKEGAIVIGKSSCEINVTSCLFEENQASKGGAFYLSRESRLFVDNSIFKNNRAGDGGIGYFLDSNGTFTNTYIYNTTGTGYGGVLTALNSKLIVKNSNFSSNKAIFGGCFYLEMNSSLAAFDSTFEESSALQGGAIYKTGLGNVTLENCVLGNNKGGFGGAIYASDINYLRLARGTCRYKPVANRGCLTLECSNKKLKCELYTYNYTISNHTVSVNSRTDEDFFNNSHTYGMIYRRPWTSKQAWRENTVCVK